VRIERAERAAPSDPWVALEAARVGALRAERAGAGASEAEAARFALEHAVELGPDRPEAYAALGRFYASTLHQPRRAISAFARARTLGAWSPRLDLELARQHLELAETERAVALLRPVASDAHGGETSREARRMLSQLDGGSLAAPEP